LSIFRGMPRGIYARAFLEGRLTEQAVGALQAGAGRGGRIVKLPASLLMPDFWQFPTVSMTGADHVDISRPSYATWRTGPGLATAIPNSGCSWVTGESDEPESLGSLGLATREGLDNLIFVVNCNLQRLDGPVRGNGKIIQELEATFRGAGWNVIR